MAVVKGAGLVMKAIIEEGDAEISAKMQDLALAEGALPSHLHTAMFTQSADSRMLTVRSHCLSVCLSLSVYLSVCCPESCISWFISVRLFVCVLLFLVRLFACLSVYLFVCSCVEPKSETVF